MDVSNCLRFVLNCTEKEKDKEKEREPRDREGSVLEVSGRNESHSAGTDKATKNKSVDKERAADRERDRAISREKEGAQASPSLSVPCYQSEALLSLRTKLLRAIETIRAAEQAKTKTSKGKPEEKETSDLKFGNMLPENIVRALPPHLVRQCIGATMRCDLTCTRRGYVLDAWDWAVQGLADMRQIITERDEGEAQHALELETELASPPATSSGARTRVSSRHPSRPNTQGQSSVEGTPPRGSQAVDMPEMLFELQVTLLSLRILQYSLVVCAVFGFGSDFSISCQRGRRSSVPTKVEQGCF